MLGNTQRGYRYSHLGKKLNYEMVMETDFEYTLIDTKDLFEDKIHTAWKFGSELAKMFQVYIYSQQNLISSQRLKL